MNLSAQSLSFPSAPTAANDNRRICLLVNKVLLEESTGGTPTDYIYLNGRPLAMLTGTTFTYLHDDMIGTPKAATNASQTVVWRGNYTPFGPAIGTSGTVTVNLRMPGQYNDNETGLWHNGMRDYSTTLGRYIESDPIGLAGGIGTYSYAENNPIAKADPKGEDDDSYDGTPQQTPIPGSNGGGVQMCDNGRTWDECAEQCYGILERSNPLGNEWAFRECMNRCLGRLGW